LNIAVELAFDLIALGTAGRIGDRLHLLGVARHDHLHEVLGGAVAALALDQHLVDVACCRVADRRA
jgi:nucleotide-binding universal stress UspA family protein